MQDIRKEHTLIFLKPDGVQRGLVGEVVGRFERAGLKLVGMKMVWPDRPLLDRHYPREDSFLRTLGGNTKDAFSTYGLDAKKETGTDDPLDTGRRVTGSPTDLTSSGPPRPFRS